MSLLGDLGALTEVGILGGSVLLLAGLDALGCEAGLGEIIFGYVGHDVPSSPKHGGVRSGKSNALRQDSAMPANYFPTERFYPAGI
jgi:hypothetical protein